jgi:hypothetical protein
VVIRPKGYLLRDRPNYSAAIYGWNAEVLRVVAIIGAISSTRPIIHLKLVRFITR